MSGNFNKRELETMIICSTRYAVGRMTYIVADVAELIEKHIDSFSQSCLEILHRDIKVEIDRGNYGMQMDLEIWAKTLLLLEKKIKPNV